MHKKGRFFDYPTKQHLIIASIIGLIGFVYFLMDATKSFSGSPFDYGNSVPITAMFIILIYVGKLYYNYKIRGRS